MKKLTAVILNILIILILFASPLFAEVLEPMKRINISPIFGTAGAGMVRGVVSLYKYDYEPDRTRDVTITTLNAEVSIKIIDEVGIGLRLPYLMIDNQNLYSASPGGSGRDENGVGNMKLGASIMLPPPSQGVDLVVGANTTLPTADEDVARKISTIEPYVLVMTRDGELSFTASAGYDIIIDEQANPGEPSSIYDNMFTAQGSAIYSSGIIQVGAQLVLESAKNTMLEFVPQVKVASGNVEWGVAVSIPIADDHPQVSTLEGSYAVIIDGSLRF